MIFKVYLTVVLVLVLVYFGALTWLMIVDDSNYEPRSGRYIAVVSVLAAPAALLWLWGL